MDLIGSLVQSIQRHAELVYITSVKSACSAHRASTLEYVLVPTVQVAHDLIYPQRSLKIDIAWRSVCTAEHWRLEADAGDGDVRLTTSLILLQTAPLEELCFSKFSENFSMQYLTLCQERVKADKLTCGDFLLWALRHAISFVRLVGLIAEDLPHPGGFHELSLERRLLVNSEKLGVIRSTVQYNTRVLVLHKYPQGRSNPWIFY